jgi:uncharacterized protein YlzI (FlbEa/FlbD family)
MRFLQFTVNGKPHLVSALQIVEIIDCGNSCIVVLTNGKQLDIEETYQSIYGGKFLSGMSIDRML